MPKKVLDLVEQVNIEPDQVTLTTVLSACAQVADDRAKQIGRKILQQMPEDFQANNYIRTSAINMLMKFGDVESAEQLFELTKKKDIIIYGAMMKG